MNKNLSIPFLGIIFVVLFSACVKDTDFGQIDDIAITPVVELNLIYFDLDAGEFFDENTSNSRLVVTDTTELRFLDDSEIQESLLRAEFYFRFSNSIPRDFEVDFQFLSETNDTTYVTETSVAPGTGAGNAPVITEYTENVEGEGLINLTMANRVVARVTIPSSDATLTGLLNLKSKTTYYLEFTERE
jgi:hypothetical protein